MHFAHDILYLIMGLLAGGLLGTVFGFCLFGAWLMGWVFPVPDSLASNDAMAAKGKARSRVENEAAFAWALDHDFFLDDIGNVIYRRKLPYAGDGE